MGRKPNGTFVSLPEIDGLTLLCACFGYTRLNTRLSPPCLPLLPLANRVELCHAFKVTSQSCRWLRFAKSYMLLRSLRIIHCLYPPEHAPGLMFLLKVCVNAGSTPNACHALIFGDVSAPATLYGVQCFCLSTFQTCSGLTPSCLILTTFHNL
jgi:hypothetical protein